MPIFLLKSLEVEASHSHAGFFSHLNAFLSLLDHFSRFSAPLRLILTIALDLRRVTWNFTLKRPPLPIQRLGRQHIVESGRKCCITPELAGRGGGRAGTFLRLLFAPLSNPSISCSLNFPPFLLLLSFHFLLTFSRFQVMTPIGPREPVSSSRHPSSPK